MKGTLFSVAIVGLLALMVATQARKGYKRGLINSLVHLALFVVCLLVSIVLTPLLAQALSGPFADLFYKFEFYPQIVDVFPAAEILLEPLAQMIFGILLFLPVLFVLYQLAKLVFNVIQRVYRKAHPTNVTDTYTEETAPDLFKNSPIAGAWVGVVSGILLTIVMLTPLVGLLSTTDRVLSMGEVYGLDTKSMEGERTKIGEYAHDVGGSVVRFCGGDLIFDSVACAKVDEQKIVLNHELDIIEDFELQKLQTRLSTMSSLTNEDIKEIKSQINVIEESFLLRVLTAQTLSWVSESWLAGDTFFGAEKPDFGNKELVDPMITEILLACSKTTSDTVVSDLLVLADFLEWGLDMKALFEQGKYLEIMEHFSSGGFEQYFLNAGNGVLTPTLLRSEVEKLAMRALVMETVNLSKEAEEKYINLLDDMVISLNDVYNGPIATQNANLNLGLKKSYNKTGVNIPSTMISTLATSMLEHFSRETEVDEAMIIDYFENMIALN